ncbi:hypothetical protein GCM10017673_52390 [Streptosporangium violaceochromogenes]|nr:hypothetical protein GCM10017673_52390 [Streptosporangium violaceochromogenes]
MLRAGRERGSEGGGRREPRLVLRRPGRAGTGLFEGGTVEPSRRSAPPREAPGRPTGGTPFDLVCAVELGGAPGPVEARLGWARELLQAVSGGAGDTGHARVAVLGYADHPVERGAENRGVIQGDWLQATEGALTTLSRFEPSPARVSGVAPVEDMLYELVRRLPGRDPARRLILVTVGERRPHTGVRRGSMIADALSCPLLRDWRRLLGRFRREPGAAGVAVVGGSPRIEEPWRRLGFTRLSRLVETDARALAGDLGMFAPPVVPGAG